MYSMAKFFRILSLILAILLLLPALPASAAEPVPTALWQHISALEEQWFQPTLTWEEIPQYFQTDYPDVPYGHGTVSSSGCGIVCLAMAATYLKDRNHSPEILANQFGSLQMNNVQRIDYAIQELDLPFAYKPRRWSQMYEALQKGQLVILLVNGDGPFTDGQHMVLLTGLTDSGEVLVMDPYEPNYNRKDLVNRYALGFPQKELAKGFDGGWIFEKKGNTDPLDIFTPYQALRTGDWNIPLG